MRRIKRTLAIVAMLIMAINANAWPWLSPYAYCMNNPVKFIDPDGRKIETSNLSEDQLMTYNSIIDGMSGYEMFNTLYNQLIESESTFTISFENRNGYNNQLVDGQFTPGADGGGNINFNPEKAKDLSPLAICEEFFTHIKMIISQIIQVSSILNLKPKLFLLLQQVCPAHYIKEWNLGVMI